MILKNGDVEYGYVLALGPVLVERDCAVLRDARGIMGWPSKKVVVWSDGWVIK